jgi:periplasmic divalent cation tolerance protein
MWVTRSKNIFLGDLMENQIVTVSETGEVQYVAVYITAANRAEGTKIARALVQEEIVACVNIFDGITSVFRWKGNIEEENECFLMAKTRFDRMGDVIERVKDLHSYDVPEIIAVPIIDGNPSYLSWIDEVS